LEWGQEPPSAKF